MVHCARLGDEARHHLVVLGELPGQHLDRDLLADHRVHRAIDRAEAAAPDLALDPVLADDRSRLQRGAPDRGRRPRDLRRAHPHPIVHGYRGSASVSSASSLATTVTVPCATCPGWPARGGNHAVTACAPTDTPRKLAMPATSVTAACAATTHATS